MEGTSAVLDCCAEPSLLGLSAAGQHHDSDPFHSYVLLSQHGTTTMVLDSSKQDLQEVRQKRLLRGNCVDASPVMDAALGAVACLAGRLALALGTARSAQLCSFSSTRAPTPDPGFPGLQVTGRVGYSVHEPTICAGEMFNASAAVQARGENGARRNGDGLHGRLAHASPSGTPGYRVLLIQAPGLSRPAYRRSRPAVYAWWQASGFCKRCRWRRHTRRHAPWSELLAWPTPSSCCTSPMGTV